MVHFWGWFGFASRLQLRTRFCIFILMLVINTAQLSNKLKLNALRSHPCWWSLMEYSFPYPFTLHHWNHIIEFFRCRGIRTVDHSIVGFNHYILQFTISDTAVLWVRMCIKCMWIESSHIRTPLFLCSSVRDVVFLYIIDLSTCLFFRLLHLVFHHQRGNNHRAYRDDKNDDRHYGCDSQDIHCALQVLGLVVALKEGFQVDIFSGEGGCRFITVDGHSESRSSLHRESGSNGIWCTIKACFVKRSQHLISLSGHSIVGCSCRDRNVIYWTSGHNRVCSGNWKCCIASIARALALVGKVIAKTTN